MLVLTRKENESIVIDGGQITLTILRIRGNQISVGIQAPGSVRAVRGTEGLGPCGRGFGPCGRGRGGCTARGGRCIRFERGLRPYLIARAVLISTRAAFTLAVALGCLPFICVKAPWRICWASRNWTSEFAWGSCIFGLNRVLVGLRRSNRPVGGGGARLGLLVTGSPAPSGPCGPLRQPWPDDHRSRGRP